MEVARRNAKMVAAWQAYGFMHGVINTDNVSILGLTIDYGPYAFMDVYDALHVCNHTDETGRYSYKAQPSMIAYALRALLDALAPLIGAESDSGKAVSKNWADDVSSEKFAEWKAKGLELRSEVDRLVEDTTSIEYGNQLHFNSVSACDIQTLMTTPNSSVLFLTSCPHSPLIFTPPSAIWRHSALN